MQESFMKEKPIFPLITSMAFPTAISMLVNALYNIVDSFFVAKISEDAMTALSLVFPIQNLINAVAVGFGVGINALIAFYLGAGSPQKATMAATHGLVFSVVHGILLTAGSILVTPVFLRLFAPSEAVIALGTEYASITFSFSMAIMLGLLFEKIFQAVGRMKITMLAMVCGCVTNILLDPLLIFGIGFLPAMGIAGAALATGIGQVVTLVIYCIVYKKQRIPVRLSRQYLKPNRNITCKLYSIGIPAILNLALPSLLISVLNALLAVYGQSYVVVLGIYYKLQTFLYLPANGIVQGMRPLIGYNFGAGEWRRVRKIHDVTLCMNGVIMALGTIVCLIAAGPIISLFTVQPETILHGEIALRIISAGFLVSAVSVTASGALEGLRKGPQSLFISLFRYVILILPAAFLLCHLFGPDSVWHAFWITELLTAIIAYGIYRRAMRNH